MDLIFGGAYQGKLEYALKKYDLSNEDVFRCTMGNPHIDMGKTIIYGLENFSRTVEENGGSPKDVLMEILKNTPDGQLEKKVFIARDISCGIVPMDKMERSWRENHGRMIIALAERCSQVERVFCGIPMRLK